MIPFRDIRWVKSVSMDEGEFAYPGRPGTSFSLHCTPEDADSLGDPAIGDLIVLTQHDQATHLVRVVGERVEARSPRTMRKGTRDTRYSMQRTCERVIVRPFEEAPLTEHAFGCDPVALGGETHLIEELPAIAGSNQPMWMVQRRILQALEGPSVRTLYVTRRARQASDMPQVDLQEFLRDRDED